MSWEVNRRLYFTIGALGLAATAATVIGVGTVRDLAEASSRVAREDLPTLAALLVAQEGLGAVRFLTARAVVAALTGDPKNALSLRTARDRSLERAREGLARVEQYPMDPDERRLWGTLHRAFADFVVENGAVWTALEAGDAATAARLQGNLTRKLPDRFLAFFDEYVELQQSLSSERATRAQRASARSTLTLLAILGASIAGSIAAGAVLGRSQSERAASEARLRLFVQEAPASLAMLDAGLRVLAVSRRWTSDFGAAGAGLAILPELARTAAGRCLEGAVERCDRDTLHRPDGTVEWVRWELQPWRAASGEVGGLLVAGEVITERVRLQERLTLSARLAALGTLVAGIGHEINNPLAVVMAGQTLALEATQRWSGTAGGPPGGPEGPDLAEAIQALEEAREGALRISRIVKDMAALAEPDPEREPVELAEVVRRALAWLPAAALQAARFEVQDLGAPLVMASSAQLEQVVVNLASNAARATRPGSEGRVVIRVQSGPSHHAQLEVTDQGLGIEPAHLERIFEPFFTTRPVGPNRGSGLGLAICHAIVAAHGGTLTVRSAVGQGSTFLVDLPPASPRSAS